MLTIKCPKTNEDVPTGVPVPTLSAFDAATLADLTVHCPRCGETHAWGKKDAFLVMVPNR